MGEQQGRRPAWLSRELGLELGEKESFHRWKKGQAALGGHKGVVRLSRMMIREAKA